MHQQQTNPCGRTSRLRLLRSTISSILEVFIPLIAAAITANNALAFVAANPPFTEIVSRQPKCRAVADWGNGC